ncbi:MAG TPA: shikimate kinase [Stellaceae bacterium]|jgi:shikimate kinase|nr:shikimate kinase [Stellaceae bacterium]
MSVTNEKTPVTAERLENGGGAAMVDCWRPPRTVVLVGLMGAGKTSVGRRLAQLLGLPFIDSDTEIEAAANATIAEIFEREGEAAFRVGERRVIARLLTGPTMIMATGGGAFMDPRTRAEIRSASVSLWLRAELDVLVSRVARRKTRPLLNQGNPQEILARLIDLRYPVYAEADIVVDSRPGPTEATVQSALDALRAYFDKEAAGAVPRDVVSKEAAS